MTRRPQEVTLQTNDGESLEALWQEPANPRSILVFCHPHPLHQGTLRAPLMEKITTRLVEDGIAVFRFNFRGVGASTGTHGGGVSEQADISAAMAHADRYRTDLPHGLAGWSFGAATSLNWMAEAVSPLPWFGIAPPVHSEGSPKLPSAEKLAGSGPKTFILGERDQFTSVEKLRSYSRAIGASLITVGADHFFYGQERRVADLAIEALFPRSATQMPD